MGLRLVFSAMNVPVIPRPYEPVKHQGSSSISHQQHFKIGFTVDNASQGGTGLNGVMFAQLLGKV
jgi:hypothetical protein